ncbi:hypothetical protein C0J52_19823 [Blattella germanica]|nr:hypothetical protein C0J52_19823 [Blattella germanica]
MTNAKLYGPFFFVEWSITGNIYLNMLELILEPQPQEDGVLDAVVFQHYGAPPHFAHIVRDYLNRTLPGSWIGRSSPRLWASRSPDRTPLDFFEWGYIKFKAYTSKVNGLPKLRNRIREANVR